MKILKLLFFLFVFTLNSFAGGRKLVVTTTLIGSVVKEIGKEKIDVEILIPPGECPGHFDIKVNDILTLEKNPYLFVHGYENYFKKIKRIVKNPEFKVFILKEERNWQIPPVHLEVLKKVLEIVSDLFPDKKDYFYKNFLIRKKEIITFESEIKEKIKKNGFLGKKVICQKYLEDLLKYLGFEVIDTYGRKEDLNPQKIISFIERGKKEKVEIVIDNLQAGPDTGKVISDELKIPHIVFSNFPGGFKNTEDLTKTLRENLKYLFKKYGKEY